MHPMPSTVLKPLQTLSILILPTAKCYPRFADAETEIQRG